MKRFVFILILFSIITCIRNPTALVEPYFDPKDLNKLELENLEEFWQIDTAGIYIRPSPSLIQSRDFLECIDFRCNRKGIEIDVFKKQVSAINYIKNWNTYANSVLREGNDHEVIIDEWWYVEDSPSCSYVVNKFNSIIMIHNFDMNDYELMNIIVEITDRIDRLSRGW